MADLDADLQGPGNGLFSDFDVEPHADHDADEQLLVSRFFSAHHVEDHVNWTGAEQLPKSGAFESENSYCTCEQGAANVHTESLTPFADHLDVEFSDNIVLSGPALDVASWYVTNPGPAIGREVTVTSITIVGNIVRLGVTPQTLNANYTLHLPTVGITTPGFATFVGLYSLDWLGVPTFVGIQMLKVIDTHTVHVIFGVPVDETDASDPLNYSVDNGLTIISATKITDFWYELKNKPRQVDGATYNFVATNIGPK